jgi:ribose-phosphate pyrophosphokinase
MGSKNSEIKIFAGSSGVNFAKKMCNCLKIDLGDSETIRFSDGNLFVKINEPVREKDVYLLQL